MQRNGMLGLFTGLALACMAVPANAETTPPAVESGTAPVMPDAAQREGVSGCCRMHFTVAADGSVTGLQSECTSPLFEDAAVAALNTLRFRPAMQDGQPVAAPGQSKIVAFEQPGEQGICKAGEAAWQDLAAAAEEGFPFLTLDTETLEPYETAQVQAEGIARGWAEYYTWVDFDTPCGDPPAYAPPAEESAAIDSMDWAALRRTGAAFEKRFAWMNCRSDMLDAYADIAADWHAAYDDAPKDQIEHWAGGIIDNMLEAERNSYAWSRKAMMAYGNQILRREEALRVRDAEAAAAPVSGETEAYDDEYEVVPDWSTPREREPEWTAADQFFYERGPGPHQQCLANAYSYAAEQQCLMNWFGGG